ncbi:5'-3' exonuclease [Bradyrhizobium sp. GM22.5]
MPKSSPKTTAQADTKAAAPKAAETKPAAATAAAKPVAAKAAGKGDHVFLVDGSGYIFRAYHALPPMNRKSDGLQVNAVLGFCNMLWKLLREMPEDNRPTHLAIIFDKSEITFRNKIYPEYKAHRQPAPDDLIPQFSLIREAVRAFDLPCLEQVGFEADDLIATYVRQACERGASATIVSSDKDLMQLVTDCVTMYDTMKDRRIGIPEVIEKFGVPPEKVVEVQALAGDSTDNVPGVPGIGIKTAAQLIVEYGDLEQLLFRATEIKQPKRREALIENAEKARISRQLVLLDDKVDLDVPLDDLAVHEPDARKLIAFLKAMEFSTLTRRVAEFSQIDPANVDADPGYSSGASVFSPLPPSDVVPAPGPGAPAQVPVGQRNPSASKEDKAASPKGAPISLAAAREEALRKLPVDRSKYQAIKTLAELNAFIARIHDAGHVAVEIRGNSIDPMQADLCGIALALAPNEACYVPLAHKQSGGGAGLFDAGLAPDQVKHTDAIEALRPVLESPGILKIGFEVKFTAVMLAQHGITLRNTDDAQLISYVLDAGRGSHALEQLSERWFGHAMLKDNELLWQRQGQDHVRPGADRQGRVAVGGRRRRDLARLARAEAAPHRRAHDHGLRDAGTPAGRGARTHGAARHLDRSSGAVASLRRLRPDCGPCRSRDPADRGRAGQCRQPEADRRHPVRQDGTVGRHQDQDRRVVDHRSGARRTRRAGPRAPAEDPGVAPGL